MGDANPTNPEGLALRAERLESSGSLIEDSSSAVSDLEERLSVAESSLVSSQQRLAQEVERQDELRTRLVAQDKFATLGALVAGIAHEMRNHLNFVNNFAEILVNLVEELEEVVRPELAKLPDEVGDNARDLLRDIDEAATKIHSHGQTSVSIMARMLQHPQGGQAEFGLTDLNALADESIRLAYHGIRAQHPGFNVAYSTELDDRLAPVMVAGQDISRVLLNVLGNAFDAVRQRAEQRVDDYRPWVQIATRSVADTVEIVVRDNGIGIDAALLPQVMTPFFTTKPPGHGTGIGLSISNDIVTSVHGGHFSIESEQGVGTSVRIVLPQSQDPQSQDPQSQDH